MKKYKQIKSLKNKEIIELKIKLQYNLKQGEGYVLKRNSYKWI